MEINLEGVYQSYLQTVGLSEAGMPETQRVQTKEAFMAGMTSLADIFTGGIPELGDDEAVQAIDSINSQIAKYWEDRLKQ